jgi:hypothetical protein
MEGAMQIELGCPGCPCRFSAPPETPADQVLDRMIDEGIWFTLAEGNTFEDMVIAALLRRGNIRCADCGSDVSFHEESLGQRADSVSERSFAASDVSRRLDRPTSDAVA